MINFIEDCPLISTELMEHLETCFPERSPRLGDSLEKIWSDSGERNIIRKIRLAYDQQRKRK